MFSNTFSIIPNSMSISVLVNSFKDIILNKFNSKSIPCAGIMCAIISVIFWSTAGLCVKLSNDVHAMEVLTISAIIQSIIFFLVMICQKQEYFGEPKERIYLFLRCTLGTVSMGCLYTSYRLIPLSDATTMRFTAPLFVSIFASVLLRESIGPIDMLNAGFTIAGVILIGRPSFLFCSSEVMSSNTIIGLVLALCAAITIAISMTVMRKLQKTNSAVVIFWFSMTTVILGLVSLWILDEFKWPSNATVWVIIVITGLCGASDQLFITLALKLENAGPIAVVRALSVVVSFIFSFTILHEKIRITSFIGGTLIFLSICIISAYKWYLDTQPKDTQPPEPTDKCCEKQTAPVYVIRPIDPSDPNILCFLEWNQNKTQQMIKV